jgi:hypothetical protein
MCLKGGKNVGKRLACFHQSLHDRGMIKSSTGKPTALTTVQKIVVDKLGFDPKKEMPFIREKLKPGLKRIDVLLRIHGTMEVGDNYPCAPTVAIPVKEALALFIHRCGIQREKAMKLLVECVGDAMKEGADGGKGSLAEALPEVEEALKTVQTEVIDKLPKMIKFGKCNLSRVSVDIVEDKSVHQD